MLISYAKSNASKADHKASKTANKPKIGELTKARSMMRL